MAIPATAALPPFPGVDFSQAATPTPPHPERESFAAQLPGGPEEATGAQAEQAGSGAPQAASNDQATARTNASAAVEELGQAQNDERESPGLRELSAEEKQRVAELKAIDVKVRAHERAHLSAAGGLARGSASFSFTTGPDGKRYAVGGEVSIDTSGVSGDPSATIAKAQNIRRAALAPANPSSQDRSVAARASQMEFEARAELIKEKGEAAREQSAPEESASFAFGKQLPQVPNLLDQFV